MFLFLHRLLILLTCDMAAKKNNFGERIWSSRCFLNPDFTVCKNLFPSKRETFFGHSLWSSVLCIILIPFKKGTMFCQFPKSQKPIPRILGKFLGNSWGMHNLAKQLTNATVFTMGMLHEFALLKIPHHETSCPKAHLTRIQT